MAKLPVLMYHDVAPSTSEGLVISVQRLEEQLKWLSENQYTSWHFSELEDPRSKVYLTHDLLDVLFLTIAAVISGAEGWSDIKDFGDKKVEWLKQFRAFENDIPADDTIARIISRLNPDKLIECFINWANSIRVKNGKDCISIDGKTLRRSFETGDRKSALHMISVWSDSNQMVLGLITCIGNNLISHLLYK